MVANTNNLDDEMIAAIQQAFINLSENESNSLQIQSLFTGTLGIATDDQYDGTRSVIDFLDENPQN